MKLGILKCDRVSEMFVAEHGHYPEMFAKLLLAVDPEIEFIEFDVEHGEFPQDIDEVDAYLITGSRHGVNDGFPWITQLEEFVRQLHAAGKKVIGICFGHQLIAKALGGKVIKSPNGWGVGISQNQVKAQKEWMTPLLEQFNLLVSHQDQVVELPKGAEILAGSDFCPNYLMQVGNNLLSVQGHPEFTKAYSEALMVSREDTIGEKEFIEGMKSLELPEDDVHFARWLINFMRA
ncbi:MAG: GMP synthase [Legionella sp.]|nr:MAG: GMP synthase [Legionella sp.]